MAAIEHRHVPALGIDQPAGHALVALCLQAEGCCGTAIVFYVGRLRWHGAKGGTSQ